MTDRQFCPACPTDMPDYRETGQWVDVEGHEHMLPIVRPDVYLCDTTPGAHRWRAYLPIWQENGWLGSQEFPTQVESMDYAMQVLVGEFMQGRSVPALDLKKSR